MFLRFIRYFGFVLTLWSVPFVTCAPYDKYNDLIGLEHIAEMPIEDKVKYWKLNMIKKTRAMGADFNKNKTKSREQYEKFEYDQLFQEIFSPKPEHLMTSREKYVHFIKMKFLESKKAKKPKTSREKYELHLRKTNGELLGGYQNVKRKKRDVLYYKRGSNRRRRFVLGMKLLNEIKDVNEFAEPLAFQTKHHKKRDLTTEKVVDYLNERMMLEHDKECAARNNKDPWDKPDKKPLAYYTSEEHLKKLYVMNERAYLERQQKKLKDYEEFVENYEKNKKPIAHYFKDHARYRNKPKVVENRKRRRRLRRNPTLRPTRTTWAVVHWTPPSSNMRFNFSQEIQQQMEENIGIQAARQKALEEQGEFNFDLLEENRTTYRLQTFRNFVDELKTPRIPYTFPKNPLDKELEYIESGLHIPSREITTPKDASRWMMDQLVSYRKGYIGLTVQHPFAHYPEYTWENEGFDLAKIDDPFPPIWPLEKMKFNAEVLRQRFHEKEENTGAPYDTNEWDDDGKHITTKYKEPTRRIIIPNI